MLLPSVGPNLYRTCIENGDEADLSRRFAAAKSVWPAKGVEILDQPGATIRRHVLTDGNLCNAKIGDAGPASEIASRDLIHMNAQYGAIVLNELMDVLGREVPSAVG
jgi:hypothetical protein